MTQHNTLSSPSLYTTSRLLSTTWGSQTITPDKEMYSCCQTLLFPLFLFMEVAVQESGTRPLRGKHLLTVCVGVCRCVCVCVCVRNSQNHSQCAASFRCGHSSPCPHSHTPFLSPTSHLLCDLCHTLHCSLGKQPLLLPSLPSLSLSPSS